MKKVLLKNGIYTSITSIPILGKEYKQLLSISNEELCMTAQGGDRLALAALAENCRKFIIKQAKKLYWMKPIITYDLYQAGLIGLIESVEKYDLKQGKFLTYSRHWIKKEMIKATTDQTCSIKFPDRLLQKIFRVHKYAISSSEDGLGTLCDHIVSSEHETGRTITHKGVVRCLIYYKDYLDTESLNKNISEDDYEELIEVVSTGEEGPEEIFEHQERKRVIEKAMNVLLIREKEVLNMRYGLDGKAPMTLKYIGDTLQVTEERIRQIEMNALRKLRESEYSESLYTYLISD